MISFKKTTSGVDLHYKPSRYSTGSWIWGELTNYKKVTLSRIFNFLPSDLTNPPEPTDDLEAHEFVFRFGTLDGEYVRIPGRILEIQCDVLISQSLELKRKLFAAERNISIFRSLAELIEGQKDIVISGPKQDAIPEEVFNDLLRRFPNSYELDKYALARVHTILSDHLDGMKDARHSYELYLNKRAAAQPSPLSLGALNEIEIQKYVFIRDSIKQALTRKENWSEREWQSLMIEFLLLLFPKYVKVLQNVSINDYYSNEPKRTVRFLDVALVDANGHLDVIEIKKPFDNKILRKHAYRGNSVPTSELSGSIMQAEKYLFHLSKWGVAGEKELNKKYARDLPTGMQIRISNPKAIIILGRDQIAGASMSRSQVLDFEVIRRKYANMMDIITYDDLLRRLDNTIEALKAR